MRKFGEKCETENAKISRKKHCEHFAKKMEIMQKIDLVDNKSKKVAKSHEKRLIFENTRLIFKE